MAKTILTVDDASTMRKLISFALSGHRILEAPDGPAALALLATASVDLIISDIHMPEMNGIELTQRIRQMPRHKDTPILIVTTESDSGTKARARGAGATGWIVKPFEPSQLQAIVQRVLGA
jgi:two-component system chemotaxis response regulator CheY